MKGTKAFQLKIVIKNSKPPIWRRVIVPAGITFSQLSMILNKAMGWCGYHVFEFEFYHQEIRLIEEAEDLDIGYGPYDYIEASTTYIREYLEENEWFTYTYDLGDDWQHRVTIEKIIDDYEYDYPQVIKYKGDCPVEDCGGIYGYYECLDIISDEANPEYEGRLSWMESQGYPCTYDMATVNEELKGTCFYKWGKGEKRLQADIYKEHYDGEYGLNATRKDKNKNAVINQSGRHKMEAAMDMFAHAFKERLALEEQFKFTSLADIFDDYSKENLLDISEGKGLKGISNYSKSSLIKKLTAHMLKPEELKAHLVCLNDVEMESFERAAYTQGLYKVKQNDVFDKLQESAYLGVLADELSVMVPMDVVVVYNSLKGREFDAERRKMSYIVACLDVVTLLYGRVPLSIFKKLVDKNTELKMTEAEIKSAIESIPSCMHECILDGDMIYSMNRYPDDKGLFKEQGDIDFYIPGRDEIIDLAVYGCNTSIREARALRQYFVKKMYLPEELAEAVCAIIQIHITEGCGVKEILPIFKEMGIEFENANQLDAFSKYFLDLWNSTRTIINRGFTPREKELMKGPEGKELTVRSNVINFKEARNKKVYPNDPCPCGSGKKYKNCCKNK